MAVDLGKRSVSEGDPTKPYVGAVIVRDGQLLGSGYRGMTGPGHHAEFGLLQSIAAGATNGASVFSTLEPCSTRNHPKVPCAQRLVEAGVKEVYIGIYDPNPVIYRGGWRILNHAGVSLYDFPADLRDEIAIDNALFLARYKTATGDAGEVEFDYALNGRSFDVQTSAGSFTVQVSDMGVLGVYVLDYNHNVAHVRHATKFSEIDDPGALDFASYYAPLFVGQIACFRNENGYLLVKLTGVDRSGGRHGVKFVYEARGTAA